MDIKNKNVLLTGGYGFIGVNLAVELEKEGANVLMLARRQIPFTPYTTYICDARDYDRLKEIVIKEKIDYIYHLAQETSKEMEEKNPYHVYSNNFITTLNMLELTKEKLISGLIIVNGWDDAINTMMVVRNYKQTYNLPITSFTLEASVFGPQDLNTGRLFPELLKGLAQNTEPKIHPSEFITRDWIYVKDVSNALVYVLQNFEKTSGDMLNVTSKTRLSGKEIIKEIELMTNKKINVKADNKKSKPGLLGPTTLAKIGWKPKYDFKTALKETIEWYFYTFKISEKKNGR